MGKERTKRHKALSDQIIADASVRPTRRKEKERPRQDEEEEFVDAKQSSRILQEARKQQEELEEEYGLRPPQPSKVKRKGRPVKPGAGKLAFQGAVSLSRGRDSDDDSDDEQSLLPEMGGDHFYEHVEVSAEDERALELFMNPNPQATRTLADIIASKLEEKKTEIATLRSEKMTETAHEEVDPCMVEMFKAIGSVLAKYRSGKLPKAFKFIPTLPNWEECLHMTSPEVWSAAAMYQATRIFASNLNASRAQRFYNLVLMPRIRDDIAEYKQLNFHLYMALKKSVFKPAAFFKGIILPLCESGNCTLREAIIIGSVITKTSIPFLHSGAALLKIAEMPYSGANSIFLRLLLDKKYALPYRVVDAVVYHFLKFGLDTRELPVLWHQSLLTFVQRYKEDISREQKSELMDLMKSHCHSQITPEIRRELVSSSCQDEETAMAVEGDVAMPDMATD